jgi:phosphoribosylaminoimidazole-succinocarboxamide synthase
MAASPTSNSSPPMHESRLTGLERIHQGKVRDIYGIDDRHMLIVTTDRLSAFDVVLPDPIPGKGQVLTSISNFWFARTRHIVPNHLSDYPLERALPDAAERALLADRAIVVRKLKPLPIEAVVRGYLIGSGWAEYRKTGSVCGIELPGGLQQAQKLPEPIFTPATKAESGHDENISFAETEKRIGAELAARVREVSLRLYREAADYAATKGIIIADTKFEFGLDEKGTWC